MNIEENENFSFNEHIIRDKDGKIEVNSFYSLLWKISIEINEKNKSKIRPVFNLKLDCANRINNN